MNIKKKINKYIYIYIYEYRDGKVSLEEMTTYLAKACIL